MDRIAAMSVLSEQESVALAGAATALRSELEIAAGPQDVDASPLSSLPHAERATYERMFELIYECSVNRSAARKLIDRITERVTVAHGETTVITP